MMAHEDTELEQLGTPEGIYFMNSTLFTMLKKTKVGLHSIYTHQALMGKCDIYSIYEFLYQQ